MVDFDAAEQSAWVDRVLEEYDEEIFRAHSLDYCELDREDACLTC